MPTSSRLPARRRVTGVTVATATVTLAGLWAYVWVAPPAGSAAATFGAGALVAHVVAVAVVVVALYRPAADGSDTGGV